MWVGCVCVGGGGGGGGGGGAKGAPGFDALGWAGCHVARRGCCCCITSSPKTPPGCDTGGAGLTRIRPCRQSGLPLEGLRSIDRLARGWFG